MKRRLHPNQGRKPPLKPRPRRTDSDLTLVAEPIDHDNFWNQVKDTTDERLRSRWETT